MALITRGVTRCARCEKVIAAGDEAVGFTVFVWNAVDPLYAFNDAAFHAECLRQDPLGAEAVIRQSETFERLGPASHRCAVCEQRIVSWKENVTIPYLSAKAETLRRFDYLQFHRSCLPRWSALTAAAEQIEGAMERGLVAGESPERLLDEFRRAATA